ncbi:Ppx/GppA phosphatase family protein [Thalassotalea marina]|uniref:Guanosine-5'-triphosphate,3'-diphosphate pyrophosphatase n=1 Tax=Thalassotalea marina TaxID=1673741 RepID=A0A919EKB2_9GAMM|nr:guanosine-5'-triphosphate,3'-diphosphate pyrophosphatase [Thalassotalea marina]GHF89757.1 guanosine-5'-triphosphate,3'-diphosphate pyrophosphatase [Thalassotalea marina]
MDSCKQPSPLYAVIDLGSNSFHMLITRQLADSVQIVDKVKRKVRLASGLDSNNHLSQAAIARGLECLSFFAERLQDIPKENVKIVATATVRLAANKDEFLQQANKVLGQNIQLLTGEEEAQYIYQGVAFTSCGPENRLVFDIGGASTEIIVGQGTTPLNVVSLNIGCVTFLTQFFPEQKITANAFEQAIQHAAQLISPYVQSYQNIGWQVTLGGSGTMQALAEMLLFSGKAPIITRDYLTQVKQELINQQHISAINIAGLTTERAVVIPSGLAILIALFDQFAVDKLQISSGALREGLLYQMLPAHRETDIRQHAVNSLMERFHVDKQHANTVLTQAFSLYGSVKDEWQLQNANNLSLLKASCQLHEIGLLIDFKHHQKHNAYIINHSDLPGFDVAEKQLLSCLVQQYKGDIDTHALQQQACCDLEEAYKLLAILRLSVILCRRRKDDVLPHYSCYAKNNKIFLCLPEPWLVKHPLIADELLQEADHIAALGLALTIQC